MSLVRGGTARPHPEFLRGVSAALALLYARPEYRPFLEEWMEAESSLRLLRKRMREDRGNAALLDAGIGKCRICFSERQKTRRSVPGGLFVRL